MMHTKFYRELMAEQGDQSPPIETREGESVDAKCPREVSQGAPQPSAAKQEWIMTFWAGTRPTEELSRSQRADPDIGPILAAKVSGNKPSSQEMITCSPATRHYSILWHSLEVRDGILL